MLIICIMSLIALALTDVNIIPNVTDYTNIYGNKTLDDVTLYCDLSGTSINDTSFNISINLTNMDNSIQKFTVLFRNNLNDPVVREIKINNIITPILLNSIANPSNTNSAMNKQEFVLTYNNSQYTVLSSVSRYVEKDVTAPVITLIGLSSINHEVNSGIYVDAGAFAIDNMDGDISRS